MAKITITNEVCFLDDQITPNSPNDVSIFVEEPGRWEHDVTGEKFTAEDVPISELHERELKYLRTYCQEQYNSRNTGATATIPKDPAKKLKRTSSFKTGKRSIEKENKLLSGGIFEVPLHTVLQIDTINSTRQMATAATKCIRDQRRNAVTPNGRIAAGGFARGYGGSLKAKPANPVNLAPQFLPQSVDDSDFLKVPRNSRDSDAKSFSTPSTPLEKRKKFSLDDSSDSDQEEEEGNPALSLTDLAKQFPSHGRAASVSENKKSLDENKLEGKNLKVPMMLKNCCDFIIQRGLEVEGIFRVSGPKKDIRTLRAEFNATSTMLLANNTNIHTVTCIIKEFLKDLPEPLLTRALYYPFLHTQKIENSDERLQAYAELVSLLPKANRDTLEYTLEFLNIVADNSEDRHDSDGLPIEGNKMDYSNLAVVIGPNILHNHKQGSSDSKNQLAMRAEENQVAIEVVRELMENHRPLFMVKAELRRKILSMIYEVKQHHFDEVLTGYTSKADDECKASELSSDCSNQHSRNNLSSLNLTNGRDGFISGTSCNSADSLIENSLDFCTEYNDRQHSTPDLSTLRLENALSRRLSRSMENSEGLKHFSADDCSGHLTRKKSIYDLTPPSSPKTVRAANQTSRTVFNKTKLNTKTTSRPLSGKLTPKQTFAQFRLDKCPHKEQQLADHDCSPDYYRPSARSCSMLGASADPGILGGVLGGKRESEV